MRLFVEDNRQLYELVVSKDGCKSCECGEYTTVGGCKKDIDCFGLSQCIEFGEHSPDHSYRWRLVCTKGY